MTYDCPTHRYEVPKILANVSNVLERIPVAELQWGTAMAAYNLPPGCAQLEACQCIFKVAAAKVQHELGDLELVWNDRSNKKQQLLLDLPHMALMQLLESPSTAVHSEATVFYTIQAWHNHQLQVKKRPVHKEQLQQLLKLIRICNCSHIYVATVMADAALMQECFTASELQMAALIASSNLKVMQDAKHPVLQQYPAWTAGRRPASACHPGIIEWKVPLSQVQALVEGCLRRKRRVTQTGPIHVCKGRELRINLRCNQSVESTGAEASATLALGSLAWITGVPEGPLRSMAVRLEVPAHQRGGVVTSNIRQEGKVTYTCGTADVLAFRGGRNLIRLGSISSWSAALEVLHDQHLVHRAAADGSTAEDFLHLRWEIELQF
jgi:hypothetical protein